MLHSLAGLKTQKSRTECRFVKTGVLRLTTHQIWDQNGPTVNLDAGMGPRYNEPLCNEVHDITNDFLDPVTVKYMKKNLDITKPSL